MAVRVGTSGYNYPEWRGTFYPEKFPAAKMLAYYAARFTTVEVNYTFYRMPSAKTVAGWAAGTPADFTFALKAPRRITHDARLRDVAEPLRYFLEVAGRLGPKLGPLLFQLPPTFRKDVARLGDVLGLLPPGVRAAVEFRHASWLADDVYECLRSRNAALCVADTGEGTTPLVATADFGYVRLRDEGYTPGDLRRWRETLARLGAEWRDTFVYLKHEGSGRAPALAQALAALDGEGSPPREG
jgi:uncharacterized protein YecE (DUF72 family)